MADLQLHSTASDGTDSPAQVVANAARLGFGTIALTDHDTMAGVEHAREAAATLGVTLIPACELSTLDEEERQIDILAYGVSERDAAFSALLRQLRGGRLGRAYAMVERLNALGYPVAWARVQELAGSENVGRPHVARAMVDAGVVPDVQSAFTPAFLLEGGRCYVQRVKISPTAAITAIHEARGVAVVAHPARTGLSDDEITELAAQGLDGIEAFYQMHREDEVRRCLDLARALGLLVTGGSDDHGDANEGRLMGHVRLPQSYVDRLSELIGRRQRAPSVTGH